VPTGPRSRARTLFYLGVIGLALFELAKVYFIMPMPGSQRIKSLDTAYVLHTWRWAFRLVALVAIGAGMRAAFTARRWWRAVPVLVLLVAAAVGIAANYVLMADHMFKQPEHLVLAPRNANKVDENSVVVGVERDGEAKAWPMRFLVYHHQVQDTIGGKPILVTYCSVCRTGRVFEPMVGGQHETFRLVGMDTFNAMFEDTRTGSWWRQATGTAVTGPLKGTRLTEVNSAQLTLRQFFALHPNALVMQPDPKFASKYDSEGRFERGESRGDLTRTDRGSWNEKSWVIGIERGTASKAFDWNELKARRVINDRVGDTPIVLALSADGQGFVAFERPADVPAFAIAGNVLAANGRSYDFSGRDLAGATPALTPVAASQEFWHSWRSFHPATQKGEPGGVAAMK
jgi:Protein of unknown function (DUF3179)